MKPTRIAGIIILAIAIAIGAYAIFSDTKSRIELLVVTLIGVLWGTSNILGLPEKAFRK